MSARGLRLCVLRLVALVVLVWGVLKALWWGWIMYALARLHGPEWRLGSPWWDVVTGPAVVALAGISMLFVANRRTRKKGVDAEARADERTVLRSLSLGMAAVALAGVLFRVPMLVLRTGGYWPMWVTEDPRIEAGLFAVLALVLALGPRRIGTWIRRTFALSRITS